MKDTCVYIHTRLDGIVFYVGMGNPKRPYSTVGRNNHWKRTTEKHEYTTTILHSGLSWEDACAVEIELIAKYRAISGDRLCNQTAGGDGGKDPTPEVRAKISAASKNRIRSAESSAKISASNKGKVLSPEQCAKNGLAKRGNTYRRGTKNSPEHRAKISAANKNPSLETREKIAAAQRGNTHGLGYKHTDEARARMSELAKKRPPRSEEVREKIRLTMIARHRNKSVV